MTEIFRKYANKRYNEILRKKIVYPRENGKSTMDLKRILEEVDKCRSTK